MKKMSFLIPVIKFHVVNNLWHRVITSVKRPRAMLLIHCRKQLSTAIRKGIIVTDVLKAV